MRTVMAGWGFRLIGRRERQRVPGAPLQWVFKLPLCCGQRLYTGAFLVAASHWPFWRDSIKSDTLLDDYLREDISPHDHNRRHNDGD